MNAPVSLRAGLSALVAAAIALAGSPGRADGDPMTDCIAASDKGLDLRKQGKLLEARQILGTCAAAACGVDISNVCRKRIADINATLPSIVFLPKDGSGADIVGAKVTVDGAGASQMLDGRPISLDPGAHTFRFEAAGQPPADRSFVLVEGARDRQERVDLAPASGATAGGSSGSGAVPPAAPAPGSGSSQKTVAYVVGGVGILGVAAGSVFGLMASSAWSTSKSDCSSSLPSQCTNHDDAVSKHDTASTDATVSTIALSVGGVALATSVVLFLTAPSSRSATSAVGSGATGLRLEASLAPGSAGITLAGGFP